MVGGALPNILLLASASAVAVSALPTNFMPPSSTQEALRSAGHAHKLTVANRTMVLAPDNHPNKASARVGFVSLNRDNWDCGAFAWDTNPKEYGNHGYTFRAETEEKAREEALKHCQEDVPENACEVKSSWCGKTKCLALAYSNDWQWYAYNSNPVTATKAMMYALDKCTQNACNARGWDKTCTSGRPLCYVEKVYCGAEAMGALYTWVDKDAGTMQFTTRNDSTWVDIAEGYEAELFARPELTLLAKTLPYKMIFPQKAVDHTVLDDSPATTNPAYVPEGQKPPESAPEAPPKPQEEEKVEGLLMSTPDQARKPEGKDVVEGGDEDPMSPNSDDDMADARRGVLA